MAQADSTQPVESWKPIAGWEGLYEVSDLGRVRSLSRIVTKSNGRTMTVNGRILKLQKHNGGYVCCTLSRDACLQNYLVHFLVAAAFIGTRPERYEVNHKDGNKKNNRANNLEYATGLENVRHAMRLGLSAIEERHGGAIITAEQAQFVHRRLAEFSGYGACTAIARELGVKPCIIYEIKYGVTWKRYAATSASPQAASH